MTLFLTHASGIFYFQTCKNMSGQYCRKHILKIDTYLQNIIVGDQDIVKAKEIYNVYFCKIRVVDINNEGYTFV